MQGEKRSALHTPCKSASFDYCPACYQIKPVSRSGDHTNTPSQRMIHPLTKETGTGGLTLEAIKVKNLEACRR